MKCPDCGCEMHETDKLQRVPLTADVEPIYRCECGVEMTPHQAKCALLDGDDDDPNTWGDD